jgi:hypothetical protein
MVRPSAQETILLGFVFISSQKYTGYFQTSLEPATCVNCDGRILPSDCHTILCVWERLSVNLCPLSSSREATVHIPIFFLGYSSSLMKSIGFVSSSCCVCQYFTLSTLESFDGTMRNVVWTLYHYRQYESHNFEVPKISNNNMTDAWTCKAGVTWMSLDWGSYSDIW